MAKDWTGNSKSTFVTLGASNHSDHERAEYDYYATEPKAIDELFKVEDFNGTIWEPACGEGHLSKRMIELGKQVISTDLIDRNYGEGGVDFLTTEYCRGDNIITNPPYAQAQEFIEHALEILPKGGKIAMFLKLTFLESEERIKLFEKNPPNIVYVFSKRILCGINGDFYQRDSEGNIKKKKNGEPKKKSSASCYAWFVWDTSKPAERTYIDWVNKE